MQQKRFSLRMFYVANELIWSLFTRIEKPLINDAHHIHFDGTNETFSRFWVAGSK